jgi:uncharacterized protein
MSGPEREPSPCVVWRFTDGKPGHDNQSAGLAEALERLGPTDVRVVNAAASAGGSRDVSLLPPPTLLVGAGRSTHRPLLRARAHHGGKAVVLMRPGPPADEYDLCVIPAHDKPVETPNVFVTEGALNRVQQASPKAQNTGLILLGGPSKHHDWLDREAVGQVQCIVAADPDRVWTVCDSRRTPPRTWSLIKSALPNLSHVHWQDVDTQWLATELALAPVAWVSEDSVSMLYEAITAGAAVGIIAVPRRRQSRVLNGVVSLIARGWATPFLVWCGGRALTPPPRALAEADRCAAWIKVKWLNDV